MAQSPRSGGRMARVGRGGNAGRSQDGSVIACIVLAAGGSSRFGSPKQLQQLSNETLAHRAVRVAVESNLSPVVLVTGANADAVEASVADCDALSIVRNREWQSGLASSIATGLRALEQHSAIDAVMITLVDQPLVTSSSLRQLLDAFDADCRIIASGYNETVGVPVVIGREHINDLLRLKGDRGAGGWIRDRLELVTVIPMPEAAIDIDSPDDLQRLSARD